MRWLFDRGFQAHFSTTYLPSMVLNHAVYFSTTVVAQSGWTRLRPAFGAHQPPLRYRCATDEPAG